MDTQEKISNWYKSKIMKSLLDGSKPEWEIVGYIFSKECIPRFVRDRYDSNQISQVLAEMVNDNYVDYDSRSKKWTLKVKFDPHEPFITFFGNKRRKLPKNVLDEIKNKVFAVVNNTKRPQPVSSIKNKVFNAADLPNIPFTPSKEDMMELTKGALNKLYRERKIDFKIGTGFYNCRKSKLWYTTI